MDIHCIFGLSSRDTTLNTPMEAFLHTQPKCFWYRNFPHSQPKCFWCRNSTSWGGHVIQAGRGYLQSSWSIREWTHDPVKARDAETLAGTCGEKTLSSLKLRGCGARVAALLLPSEKNLPGDGVKPQRSGARRQGARIQDQGAILHPRSAWCPGFSNYWGNKLCVYVRIFTAESVLNEIVPFITQLSLSPFPFSPQCPKPLIL